MKDREINDKGMKKKWSGRFKETKRNGEKQRSGRNNKKGK